VRSNIEVKNLKLQTIPVPLLRELARLEGVSAAGGSADLVKRLLQIPDARIDQFIKGKYAEKLVARRDRAPDHVLQRELERVDRFSWGTVQGGLDQKIQRSFVRRYSRFDELLGAVRTDLFPDVESYVVCTWYNHWSTVLIEDHISKHANVVPTLKEKKGIDLFFRGQPFDLKTTKPPRGFELARAIEAPRDLLVALYEKQGAERFGADPRMYVVLVDEANQDESWKLKRDTNFVFPRIDEYLETEQVSEADEVVFKYGGTTHTTVAKLMLFVRQQ
jgi:hypothetical protein